MKKREGVLGSSATSILFAAGGEEIEKSLTFLRSYAKSIYTFSKGKAPEASQAVGFLAKILLDNAGLII